MPSFSDFAGCEGFSLCSKGVNLRWLDYRAIASVRLRLQLHPPRWSLNQNPFAEHFSEHLKDQHMKNVRLILAMASSFLVSTAPAQFASSLISYERGTGFAANFTNSSAALGSPDSGTGVTPYAPPFSTSQLVSIGSGGWLTLQLGTPILNDASHPFGIDFLLFGNSFFVTTNGTGASARTSGAIFTSSSSTRVEVSADGSSWFTLDSTLAPTVGTLFPTDGTENPLVPVNPALTSSDFAGLNLAGIRSLYNGSAGGAGFDLGWARDGDGNVVDLESASYVRIDVLSGRTQIDAISAVPEPATGALLLVFSGFLCVTRRRLRS